MESERSPTLIRLIVFHQAFFKCSTTDNMMKNELTTKIKAVLSGIGTGTAGEDNTRTTISDDSIIRLAGKEKSVKVTRVFHLSHVEQSSASVSSP